MKYNPDIHHRKSIRLKGYDYSKPGIYFITICTRDRELYFEQYPELKKIVFYQWCRIPERYNKIKLDEFCIMPNHIHGIIENVGVTLTVTPENKFTPENTVTPENKFTHKNPFTINAVTPKNKIINKNVDTPKNTISPYDTVAPGKGGNSNMFGVKQKKLGDNQYREGDNQDRIGGNQDRSCDNQDRIGGNQDRIGGSKLRERDNQNKTGDSQLREGRFLKDANGYTKREGGFLKSAGANLKGAGARPAPTVGLGEIIGTFKSLCFYDWLRYIKENNINAVGKFWQRNYYEHIIRNENELTKIREYIINNPLKWEEDYENPNRRAEYEDFDDYLKEKIKG